MPIQHDARQGTMTLQTRANAHGIHPRLRGLNPRARDRLAERFVEGCQQPDGRYLAPAGVAERTLTGESRMAAGFTLRPMRGDDSGVQLRFEQVDAQGAEE